MLNGTPLASVYKFSRYILCLIAVPHRLTLFVLKVPHAFQHRLSAELRPTLSEAIPAFEAMMQVWAVQQVEFPDLSDVIQAGLDKLQAYMNRTQLVPAYVVAMGMLSFQFQWLSKLTNVFSLKSVYEAQPLLRALTKPSSSRERDSDK